MTKKEAELLIQLLELELKTRLIKTVDAQKRTLIISLAAVIFSYLEKED